MPPFQRRPVEKVDNRGRVIEWYPSVKAAAAVNYMATTTVRKWCNGGRRYPYDDNGHALRWAKESE